MMKKIMLSLLRPRRFPGKYRLLHWICPTAGEETIELFGYKIRLDLGDFIQRCMYLNVYEQRESSLIKGYLQPGMTFVDAGANVGYYTLMAASLVGPEGAVFAFEPSPYAFGRLIETVQNNPIPQVRAFQAGLSDVSGRARLYMQREAGRHTPGMIPHEGRDPIDVSVDTLDRFLAANGVEHVDLLKIDVEGFEPNVIRGAEGSMRRGKIRSILCEFNRYELGMNNSSTLHLYQTFVRHGYRTVGKAFDPDSGYQNLLFILAR